MSYLSSFGALNILVLTMILKAKPADCGIADSEEILGIPVCLSCRRVRAACDAESRGLLTAHATSQSSTKIGASNVLEMREVDQVANHVIMDWNVFHWQSQWLLLLFVLARAPLGSASAAAVIDIACLNVCCLLPIQ